jgi:carbamoyltransferase
MARRGSVFAVVIVLGINAFGHDAAAVLLVDGRVAYASSEERHDRVRHSAAFPSGAVRAALETSGVAARDVEAVAFPWSRGMGRARKAWHGLTHLPRSLAFLREPPDDLVPGRLGYLGAMAAPERGLRPLGVWAPLVRVPHHLAHAASARLALPGGEGAVLTADGMGEWTTAAAWRSDAQGLARLRRAVYPHSPGKAYAAVTRWLGFRPEADEGKTMGLAAHGDPAAPGARFARALLVPDARRLLRVDVAKFGYPWGEARLYGDAFVEALGPARRADEPLRPGDADVARGIQDALEAFALDASRRLLRETGARRLALAGGTFLNCAATGVLLRALDAEVIPFPVAGDAGAAWGAAADVHRRATGRAADPLGSLRLGGAIASHEDDLASLAARVAARIARGGIVGVARGRSEFGPRALGARSVLASPRTAAIRDDVNRRKGREAWRPLAPVLRAEDEGWFERAGPSPHMILTFVASERARREVPGAVHADGTARVQTVTRDDDPFLHALLGAMASHGHPPVLLNTSLNRRGEPIVETADQALAAARAMGLDALLLGDDWLDPL